MFASAKWLTTPNLRINDNDGTALTFPEFSGGLILQLKSRPKFFPTEVRL